MLTYYDITKNESIKTYIVRADESLGALGFTEHSFAHVMLVAETAGYILKTMGHDDRTVELAKIAGYHMILVIWLTEKTTPSQELLWPGVS